MYCKTGQTPFLQPCMMAQHFANRSKSGSLPRGLTLVLQNAMEAPHTATLPMCHRQPQCECLATCILVTIIGSQGNDAALCNFTYPVTPSWVSEPTGGSLQGLLCKQQSQGIGPPSSCQEIARRRARGRSLLCYDEPHAKSNAEKTNSSTKQQKAPSKNNCALLYAWL